MHWPKKKCPEKSKISPKRGSIKVQHPKKNTPKMSKFKNGYVILL
jgi:hypothetical protein